MKKTITIQAVINAPIEKVWDYWVSPKHITQWNFASDDWKCPKAENDLRSGGRFNYRMEAKDGSAGFYFGGVYDKIRVHQLIVYTLGDGRKVKISFVEKSEGIEVVENFEAENTNPIEMQRGGWQAILNNFKKYVEEIKTKQRCEWVNENPLMVKYHDMEWGVPVHDDKKLFEFLILEGAQAGLTWQTVLNKRENYRKAFNNFDPSQIAKYTDNDVKRLLGNSGIIRNRLKIMAAIANAKKFLEIQKEFGSFDKYIWQFVKNKQIKNNFESLKDIPATTEESDSMSKDLLKKGFKFVGSTICYAFMQAVGMVNDHEINCFKFDAVQILDG